MILELLLVALLTFLPFLELRFSIPFGILEGTIHLPFGISLSGLGLPIVPVFLTAILSNILLGLVLYPVLQYVDGFCHRSRYARHYIQLLDRSRRKMRPYVKKYGVFGASLFIGVPIPGSGVFSGSLGALVLGMSRRNFYKALVLGVLIAGLAMTLLTVTGMSIF